MRLPAVLLACLALTGTVHAAADDDPAPTFLRVNLPDGNKWVLGPGGIGRPFIARLLLDNRTKAPVTLWDYKNSEGATCPGVIITDDKGNETILRPPPIERAAGVPTVITIEPTRVIAIDLELLRLIGERDLPPGRYKLRGLYENKLKADGAFVRTPVWTGRIESEPVAFEVVSPAPPKGGQGKPQPDANAKAPNGTESFLGAPEQWPACGIDLADIHGLWGGTAVHLRGSGECVVRAVRGPSEKRYRFNLTPQETNVLRELCISSDLLSVKIADRAGVPDEGRPAISLRNSKGESRKVTKWANDKVESFDRVYQALLDLRKPTEAAKAEYDGPIQRDWRP